MASPISRRVHPDRPAEEGVYLLANDGVAPWLTACAASLRRFNPSLRVIVIAFDRAVDHVAPLCAHHGFELWNDRRLTWFDRLGDGLARPGRGHVFRKLAALSGPLDRFFYVDVDTLVLMDLAPVFDAVAAEPDTIHFAHCDGFGGNIDEVYRTGAWREDFLARHGSHAGSAGIWGASRDVFTRAELTDFAASARPVADQLVAGDQSFLNYCIDTSGTPVANLHDHIAAHMVWAGVPGYSTDDRELRSPNGRAIGVVHWAGYALTPTMPYRDVWERWASADPVPRPSRPRAGLVSRLRGSAHA